MQVHTVTHTVCPLFLHKPTQVYCLATFTLQSIGETRFCARSKAAVWGCRLSRSGREQRRSHERASVIRGFQYAQAESQVPVVFCAVLLEVFSGHALRGTLLELHIPETTFFGRPLENKRQLLSWPAGPNATHVNGTVKSSRTQQKQTFGSPPRPTSICCSSLCRRHYLDLAAGRSNRQTTRSHDTRLPPAGGGLPSLLLLCSTHSIRCSISLLNFF